MKTRYERPMYISVIRFFLRMVNPILLNLPIVGKWWLTLVSEGIVASFVRSHEKAISWNLPERYSILSRRARQRKDIVFTFTSHPPSAKTRTFDDEGSEWNNGLQKI